VRIVARNRAAQQGGLAAGELLSNARSKVRDLQTCEADPAADAAALRRLALWAVRYTPIVAAWGETGSETGGADGLFLDITGCAHLFGGEDALLADLERRLRAFSLFPRLAVADTAGASWAMARHGGKNRAIVPSGGERDALENLPLAALRLGEETQLLMRRLGFRRIGEVIDQPRAPFAARFAPEFLLRLDQALGRAPEPLNPVAPPPVYRAQAHFVEPIMAQEHVLEAATRLLHALAEDLAHAAAGVRVVQLLMFRVDGGVVSLDLGLAAPSRDAQHIARLIALRLDRLGSELDAEFGFEAAAIHVLVAEPLPDRQARLGMGEEDAPCDGLAQLVDRLDQRLGRGAVCQLHPYQSHVPERAVRATSPSPVTPEACLRHDVGEGRGGGDRRASAVGIPPTPNPSPHRVEDAPSARWGGGWAVPSAPRPLLLLPQPEAADVLALIPDGPPRQFRWRGVLYQVTGAQGPERITPEWWRRTNEAPRDYYVVEDMEGRRFWLYRAGLYGRGDATPPQWFVHGVFG